jgi:hypothetical protein
LAIVLLLGLLIEPVLAECFVPEVPRLVNADYAWVEGIYVQIPDNLAP